MIISDQITEFDTDPSILFTVTRVEKGKIFFLSDTGRELGVEFEDGVGFNPPIGTRFTIRSEETN